MDYFVSFVIGLSNDIETALDEAEYGSDLASFAKEKSKKYPLCAKCAPRVSMVLELPNFL